MMKQKRKVVITLHGINTVGLWQKEVAPVISEQGWVYYPLDYGNFSPFKFMWHKKRDKKVSWFRNEFDDIREHIDPVVPSVIAHSFGTLIVCEALEKYEDIVLDKLILCGSIVPQDFDWRKIIERNQVTTVKNDSGGKDLWAGLAGKFVKGTGPSGRDGFAQKHAKVLDDHFALLKHSDFFGYGHYTREWVPFLENDVPYFNGAPPPTKEEEPVSPIEAARWSALTYYHLFIIRAVEAIRRREIFPINGAATSAGKPDPSRKPIEAKGLIIAIPETPGGATSGSVADFSNALGLKDANMGFTPRTVKYGADGWLYDLPTTLNTLGYLDHREDNELAPAVLEFQRMLEKALDSPTSDARALVKTETVAKLTINRGYR